jgi:hypothetical protein
MAITTHQCDGCDEARRDVKSVGVDGNGEPDAPDLCFLCRKEAERGRIFDTRTKRYVRFVSPQQ